MNSTEDSTDGRHRPDPVPSMQNRLRLTAQMTVGVSLVSAVALANALHLLLRDQPAGNYYQVIQSLTRSQDRLAFAMVTAGAMTILLAGLLTWIITLYSSHRVAGLAALGLLMIDLLLTCLYLEIDDLIEDHLYRLHTVNAPSKSRSNSRSPRFGQKA